jgi:hypothetical protein
MDAAMVVQMCAIAAPQWKCFDKVTEQTAVVVTPHVACALEVAGRMQCAQVVCQSTYSGHLAKDMRMIAIHRKSIDIVRYSV